MQCKIEQHGGRKRREVGMKPRQGGFPFGCFWRDEATEELVMLYKLIR